MLIGVYGRRSGLMLALAMAVAIGAIGCRPSSSDPVSKGYFRLAVTNVFIAKDQAVWRLEIESSMASGYSIEYPNSQGGRGRTWNPFSAVESDPKSAQSWVAASKFPSPDHDLSTVRALFRSGGTAPFQAEVNGLWQVTPSNHIADSIVVEVPSGEYPLDKPLVVGRTPTGEIVLKVVGRSADPGAAP